MEMMIGVFSALIPIGFLFLRIESRLSKLEVLIKTMCDGCDSVKPGDPRLLKLHGVLSD
jgi:hypothetical protein